MCGGEFLTLMVNYHILVVSSIIHCTVTNVSSSFCVPLFHRHCGQAFFYKVPLPPPEPETGEEGESHCCFVVVFGTQRLP